MTELKEIDQQIGQYVLKRAREHTLPKVREALAMLALDIIGGEYRKDPK